MINFGPDELFIKNYKELKSSRKMGELYGCDKKSITSHAKKIGYDYSNNKELKITNIPISQIIEDYEKLQSAKLVGEKYGCSGTAVLNYLKKNNYKITNHNHKLKDITEEDFILKYEELKSAEKMSEYYNCSSTAILQYAKKIGYNPNASKHYKLTEQQKQEILLGYNTTSSVELAKHYNVSRGMITKIWYDNNCLGKQILNPTTTKIDLTGQRFGKWSVLYCTDRRDNGGNVYWHCKCDCGVERDVLSSSLRAGTSLSCGAHKNISRGSEKIKNILLEANIPFETEKTFSDCQDKKCLPFDFYVNNNYLIEYDGEQHYDENSIFDYEYTHFHDEIKNEWCKKNNITLIRIPYTHYNNLVLQDLIPDSSSFICK